MKRLMKLSLNGGLKKEDVTFQVSNNSIYAYADGKNVGGICWQIDPQVQQNTASNRLRKIQALDLGIITQLFDPANVQYVLDQATNVLNGIQGLIQNYGDNLIDAAEVYQEKENIQMIIDYLKALWNNSQEVEQDLLDSSNLPMVTATLNKLQDGFYKKYA